MRIHRVLGGMLNVNVMGRCTTANEPPGRLVGKMQMQVHGRTRESKMKKGKEGNRCGGAGARCAGVCKCKSVNGCERGKWCKCRE